MTDDRDYNMDMPDKPLSEKNQSEAPNKEDEYTGWYFKKDVAEAVKKLKEEINNRIEKHTLNFKRYNKETAYAKKKRDFSQETYSEEHARIEIKIIDELNELQIELYKIFGDLSK